MSISVLADVSTLSRGISYSVEALVPVWLVWLSVRTRRDLLLFIDWSIVIGCLAALVALREEVTQSYAIAEKEFFFFHAPDRGGGIRIQGVFPHPLVFGAALAMLLPLAVGRAFSAAGTGGPAGGGAAVLFCVALFFTSSRGPWMAALIGLVLLAALMRGGARLGIAAALLCGIAAIAFSPSEGRIATLVRGVVDPNSAQAAGAFTVDYRRALWNHSVDYATTHPFGTGPGRSSELSFTSVVGGNATNLDCRSTTRLRSTRSSSVLSAERCSCSCSAPWSLRRGGRATSPIPS